jgi:hypothetical protein
MIQAPNLSGTARLRDGEKFCVMPLQADVPNLFLRIVYTEAEIAQLEMYSGHQNAVLGGLSGVMADDFMREWDAKQMAVVHEFVAAYERAQVRIAKVVAA